MVGVPSDKLIVEIDLEELEEASLWLSGSSGSCSGA
jgi:hypothetical protein